MRCCAFWNPPDAGEDEDERQRRRVTVREKGDQERIVLLTAKAESAMKAWLEKRSQIGINDEHVFLGRESGRPWKPLTPSGISSLLQRYKMQLNLAGRCSPHQWRHRWFRKLIRKGMGTGKVSQLGGHSTVVVTDLYYGGLDMDELQDIFDQFAD